MAIATDNGGHLARMAEILDFMDRLSNLWQLNPDRTFADLISVPVEAGDSAWDHPDHEVIATIEEYYRDINS